MQQFMYWARILGENQYLRHTWQPARELTGLGQSTLITQIRERFERSRDPVVVAFVQAIPYLAESPAIAAGLRELYRRPELQAVIEQWWREDVGPRFPAPWRAFAAGRLDFMMVGMDPPCGHGALVLPDLIGQQQILPCQTLETIDEEATAHGGKVGL